MSDRERAVTPEVREAAERLRKCKALGCDSVTTHKDCPYNRVSCKEDDESTLAEYAVSVLASAPEDDGPRDETLIGITPKLVRKCLEASECRPARWGEYGEVLAIELRKVLLGLPAVPPPVPAAKEPT